jgi:hypothetical protein
VATLNSDLEIDGDDLPTSSYGKFPAREIPLNRRLGYEEYHPCVCGNRTQVPTHETWWHFWTYWTNTDEINISANLSQTKASISQL